MSQQPPASNRQTTEPEPAEPLACVRCQAPLGATDKRCPFCGAPRGENRGGISGPVIEPAKIGLLDSTKAGGQGRALVIIKPRRQLPSLMTVIGGLVLVGAVGFGSWVTLREDSPPPRPSAPVRPPPLPPVLSSVSGIAVPDATHADPTLLLPRAQRALFPEGGKVELVRIQVSESRKGTVDLSKEGPRVLIVYATPVSKDRPREVPLMHRGFLLKAGGGGPEQIPAQKTDTVVPEPNCTWPAAWRAAVKSGVPEDLPADGLYEQVNGEPRWRVTVPDRPDLTRDVNGMNCALKPH